MVILTVTVDGSTKKNLQKKYSFFQFITNARKNDEKRNCILTIGVQNRIIKFEFLLQLYYICITFNNELCW